MKFHFMLLASIAMLGFSCNNKQEQELAKEIYPVTSPIILDTNTYQDYVAEIYAVQNIEIRAKAQGYLEKVHVDEGSKVQTGQLLFSINNREYSENLSKNAALRKIAQAEEKSASLELENTKTLVDKNIVSKIEYEFAKNKLQVAKARVEEAVANEAHARQMLSYTEIRAPFSGTINRIPHKIGSLIAEGTLLTTLSQNKEVFAYFDISEKEYLEFMSKLTEKSIKDRQVKLILANGELHKDIGVIETMDGEIDEKTGNLAVRARFNNSNNLLKHGASGKIRIDKRLNNALIIPQKSTFEIQDRLFVYTIGKDGKTKMKPIEIATRIPHFYIVSKGLSTEDKIIYEGIQSVADGSSVKQKFIPMKKIIHELSKF